MKQAERTARTKAALIDAFWKLYKTKPIDQISVREITNGAGVYRSTFYLYFQDAATVLALLEDELIDRLSVLLDAAEHKNQLADIPFIVASFYKKEGSYLYPLLKEGGDHAFAERVLELITPCIKGSDCCGDDQVARAVRFYFYASVALVSEAYPRRRKEPLDDVAAFAATLIAGGAGCAPAADATGVADVSDATDAADADADAEADVAGNDNADELADTSVAAEGVVADEDIAADEGAVVDESAADEDTGDEPEQKLEATLEAETKATPEPKQATEQEQTAQPKPEPTKKKRAAKPKKAKAPKQEEQLPAAPPDDEDIQMALF